MPRKMLPDGTWIHLTDEQFIAEYGEDRLREIRTPITDPETLTEGRRALLERMQAEQDLHEALKLDGIKTLDDLPVAGEPV